MSTGVKNKPGLLNKAFLECVEEAKLSNQRRLFVLSGEKEWGRQQLNILLQLDDRKALTVLTDQDSKDVFNLAETDTFLDVAKANKLLGSDSEWLVYDAYAGFNPDAVGAAAGTVQGGGVMILLTPDLDHWQNFLDPDYRRLLIHPFKPEELDYLFIQRVAAKIKNAKGRWIYSQASGLDQQSHESKISKLENRPDLNKWCFSHDQSLAVDAIVKVVKGHRRRPLVITSDRGRGKSTALGIASAQLLLGSLNNILITAPRLESVTPVFKHALDILTASGGEVSHDAGSLTLSNKQLKYIAPDQLLRQLPKVDLLLIDEAAAIPLPMLQELLQHYSRVVFSSTVHGYEGSGRGFGLRFFSVLDEFSPQWKHLELKQAIRWAEDDPVEAWIFDTLLLNAEYSVNKTPELLPENCEYKEINKRDLVADENLLRQVFALLVLAHYQTTPSDLRNLLDGPNIRVWVVLHNEELVATALVTDEGGFTSSLATEIWKGKRRFRGHMLPQTLAAHSGVEVAPTLSYQRIMRIAVHPSLQQKGFGQILLVKINERSRQLNIDIVGSSFGVTEDVLHFWQKAGFTPVRLGVGRDACSGTHSALVLKSNNLSGEILLDSVRFKFLDHFPHQLLTMFNGLEPALVAGLMLGNDYYDAVVLDEQDWL
ncbi:MAG: tRNA(Met) cytidine acetyltransferase, partial [Pseudohongiellaceae bacterium]